MRGVAAEDEPRRVLRRLGSLDEESVSGRVAAQVAEQPHGVRVELAGERGVAGVEQVVPQHGDEPGGELVRLERPVVAVRDGTVRFGIRARLDVALGRLVLREHPQRAGQVGAVGPPGGVEVALREPQVAAPDEAVALGAVGEVGVVRAKRHGAVGRRDAQRRRARGDRGEPAGAHARAPERLQRGIGAGERADDGLGRVRAAVLEADARDAHGGAGRVEPHADVAHEALLQRRLVAAGAGDAEIVEAVDAGRKDRKVDLGTEVARACGALEVAVRPERRDAAVGQMEDARTARLRHLDDGISADAVRPEVDRPLGRLSAAAPRELERRFRRNRRPLRRCYGFHGEGAFPFRCDTDSTATTAKRPERIRSRRACEQTRAIFREPRPKPEDDVSAICK